MSHLRERDPCLVEVFKRLDGLAATLGAITALIGSATLTASAAAQVNAEAQGQTEQVYQTIEQAVRIVQNGGQHHGPHFGVVDLAPDVASAFIDHTVLAQHHALDVMIDVRASAQIAGLVLSFAGYEIPHTITLRITGNRGASEVTIVSGGTVENLAAALWSVYQLTGVQPCMTGTGVGLFGDVLGSDGFVSVQLLHPTSIAGESGIYRLDPHNVFQPDPASRIAWESCQAFEGVWDFGQDLQATVNGLPAEGHGLTLRVWSPQLRLETTLQVTQNPWPGHGFTLGNFRAFRIVRD